MSLTPESIAETWSNGGTVQIATPADLNVFNEYVSTHYSADTMRNAEITADLDFEDGEIAFTPMSASNWVTNLTLDGNGHTINGIVEDALNANSIFFYGIYNNADTAILRNVIIYKCNITLTGRHVITSGTIRNVIIDHCRFTTTNGSGYIGVYARDIQDYSSAATIYCNNGGDYYGIYGVFNSKNIALLDTVYRNTAGGTAIALRYEPYGVNSLAFTRNRFHNFATVIGIFRHWQGQVSTTYAAITAENATEIYPCGGVVNSSRPTASYYDNVLVPNAAAYTDLGLTTSELQSVATMTAKGFAVEEA